MWKAHEVCHTLQAFKTIVDLATRFPGLRLLFLRSVFMAGVTVCEADFVLLWDRPNPPAGGEWSFWRTLAAICLSDTEISKILEHSMEAEVADYGVEGWLSDIERLLIAHQRSGSSFTRALCVRYLVAALDSSGLWADGGAIHGDIARKVCIEIAHLLKYIGADSIPLPEHAYDYEGVDLLIDNVLLGISGWVTKLNEGARSQLWFDVFFQVVELVRRSSLGDRLPNSSARVRSDAHNYVEWNIWINKAEDPGSENPDTDESAQPETPPLATVQSWDTSKRASVQKYQMDGSDQPAVASDLKDPICTRCQESVVELQNDSDSVVRFGESFFHPACFTCTKCDSSLPRIAGDNDLFLVLTDSDGTTPICTRCAYHCAICTAPILGEALLVGGDVYHAECFRCRMCRRGIDKRSMWVTFTKTHRGAYCMRCYNARLSKIQVRKHDTKKAV
ncbi:hypothetical protein GGX14DRAFT_110278 [Mycena pura]|uniref:LIM zinc-binding domain-containing protein n=1 Tax=Mycena pura TaxID=153505 RepID=A0AAD6YCC8_9AGAR|nr:hypothetical protein GGX14DRAFT_110278 [Mycena pura]